MLFLTNHRSQFTHLATRIKFSSGFGAAIRVSAAAIGFAAARSFFTLGTAIIAARLGFASARSVRALSFVHLVVNGFVSVLIAFQPTILNQFDLNRICFCCYQIEQLQITPEPFDAELHYIFERSRLFKQMRCAINDF